MRRAPTSSAIERSIDDLIDRLTGQLETRIDTRARALISSWTRNGVSRKDAPVASSHAPAHPAATRRPLIPLPRAERDFRVAYLRALLAEAPNRREAARRAGVPYRTLCDMVRKLLIDG